MGKGRLEAFSDGVFAVIITIMVLELKAPSDARLEALRTVLPALSSYVLSFVYVGIYWNNHHHVFQAVDRVDGATLWANLHLMFWLSLVPFVTKWMGESCFATWPTAAYGLVMLLSALAWEIARRVLVRLHDRESALAKAMGGKVAFKEGISLALYALAIGAAFFNTWISCSLYALVAAIWIVPDRRIAREVERRAASQANPSAE